MTGGEALYADMGHFGAQADPVRAGIFFVLPALMLNYLGQGALLLPNPEAVEQPVLPAACRSGRCIPMVVLATAATVIASQAVITGAYSVARQAIQLGYMPRMRIRHTSQRNHRPDLHPVRSTGC